MAPSAPLRARLKPPRVTRAHLARRETQASPCRLPLTVSTAFLGLTKTCRRRQNASIALMAPPPWNQANRSASSAHPGPSFSPPVPARFAPSEPIRERPRRIARHARPESTSPPPSRRRAFRVRLELMVTKQNSPTPPLPATPVRPASTAQLWALPTRRFATRARRANMAPNPGWPAATPVVRSARQTHMAPRAAPAHQLRARSALWGFTRTKKERCPARMPNAGPGSGEQGKPAAPTARKTVPTVLWAPTTRPWAWRWQQTVSHVLSHATGQHREPKTSKAAASFVRMALLATRQGS